MSASRSQGVRAPLLDVLGGGAHTGGVASRSVTNPPAAAQPSAQGKRRRRPSNAKETMRRKQWGRQWGQILSDAAKQLKAEGE